MSISYTVISIYITYTVMWIYIVSNVNMSAGTLLVKHGSHSSHEDFFENATVLSKEEKQQTEDFYKFQDQERTYFHKFENRVLSAKAGSLFLWDSRLAHQNLLPGEVLACSTKPTARLRGFGVPTTTTYKCMHCAACHSIISCAWSS